MLALLAMHRGGLVPISTLIEEIWPTDPPATAVTTLQTYVYQLRRTFSEATGNRKDILLTKPLGYVANIPAEDIDVHRFDQLVESGRRELEQQNPHKASELLHAATNLWSGKVLWDVHRGPLLEAHATRLEEAGLQALLIQAEADLRIGRHEELVGELRGLLTSYPWHEGLCAKLMVALYRCERRSHALEIYNEVSRSLAEELGIDPSPNLQKLYQAVLTDAPWLRYEPESPQAVVTGAAAPALRPAQLPGDLPDFHAREDQLAELDRLLTPERNAPQVVTITGMPGVGKTALALHAAHAACGRFPDAQLYTCLASSTDQPVSTAEALRGFLRDLGEGLGRLPADEASLACTFRSRVAHLKGLLVIDDARSAEQIRPLLPGGPHWSVIVTARHLTGLLPGSHDVVVGPLSTAESIDLLDDMLGDRDVRGELADATRLTRRCGGLPLALWALGRRLSVNRHWSVGKLAQRVTDTAGLLTELREAGLDLRGYLHRAFRDLADPDREALYALGRASEAGGFDIDTAAALTGTDTRTAEDTLDRLSAAHLMHPVPGASGKELRYVLHPLLRAVLTPARRSPMLRPPHILPVHRPVPAAVVPRTVHVA